jgi:hypothetical protein
LLTQAESFFIKAIRDAGNERVFRPEREKTRGTEVPVFFLSFTILAYTRQINQYERKTEVTKTKKEIGVQQVLMSPNKEIQALLEYLCQQSGKLYNSGVYVARQTFFKTGKLLTGKFDLSFESSVVKSLKFLNSFCLCHQI